MDILKREVIVLNNFEDFIWLICSFLIEKENSLENN